MATAETKEVKRVTHAVKAYDWKGFTDILTSNGNLELGIAAGADPSLSDSDRLIINGDFRTATGSIVAANHSVANLIARASLSTASPYHIYLAAAARTIVGAGWMEISKDGKTVIDGDITMSATPITDALTDAWKAILDPFDYRSIAFLIIATKVNWVTMNHHVGQTSGVALGYAGKVINTLFGDKDQKEMCKVAHKIGHWAGTRAILTCMGYKIPETPCFDNYSAPILAADDLAIRTSAPVAGTHKYAVCLAAAKRLLMHPLIFAYPDRNSLIRLVLGKVNLNDLKYHPGAIYLGLKRETLETGAWSAHHGKLASFIHVFHGTSTLSKSPHITNPASYEGFDPEWEGSCNAYKRAAARAIIDPGIMATSLKVGEIEEELVKQLTTEAIPFANKPKLAIEGPTAPAKVATTTTTTV